MPSARSCDGSGVRTGLLPGEREILATAAAWFARRDRLDPVRHLRVRESQPRPPRIPSRSDVRARGSPDLSGYYAWQGRAPSARGPRAMEQCYDRIRDIQPHLAGTHGAPRVSSERSRLRCGPQADRQIDAPCRALPGRSLATQGAADDDTGCACPCDRIWSSATSPPTHPIPAQGRVEVHHATGPVPTWAGFLYLGVEADACGRGTRWWAPGGPWPGHRARQLVLDALDRALQRRPDGVIHHSDSEYLGAGSLGVT